jgi:hypothetical protein
VHHPRLDRSCAIVLTEGKEKVEMRSARGDQDVLPTKGKQFPGDLLQESHGRTINLYRSSGTLLRNPTLASACAPRPFVR